MAVRTLHEFPIANRAGEAPSHRVSTKSQKPRVKDVWIKPLRKECAVGSASRPNRTRSIPFFNGIGAGEAIGNTQVSSLYNNTISRNTTSLYGGTGGLYYGGSAPNAYIANNIFWSNTTYALYLRTSNGRLSYNDISTLGGIAPLSSIGNLSLAPNFINAAGGDFHLAGSSPLLGAVPQAYSSIDPDGMTSASGDGMDMGAYYETIFIDGFDGD